jgi:hypothetical protein
LFFMSSSQDWLGLQGQVCVVTGAASGIGAAVASGLAAAGACAAGLLTGCGGSSSGSASGAASSGSGSSYTILYDSQPATLNYLTTGTGI